MNFTDQEALIQKNAGNRIRQVRRAKKISSTKLAFLAGISQGYISKIENGKAALQISVLSRLSQILERPVEYFLKSSNEQPRIIGSLITVAGPESQAINWLAQEISRLTDKRLMFIPLQSSQLGSGSDQIQQLLNGEIDLFIEDLSRFHQLCPDFDIFSLPYVFDNETHLKSFINENYFHKIMLKSLHDSGIIFVNPNWNWRRGVEWVLVAKRPIPDPEGIRGLRVRVHDSKVQAAFWKELGAVPVSIPWVETKDAMQAGKIDVLPTHKSHVYPLKFCDLFKHVTLLGDLSPVLGIAINNSVYQLLLPDIQNSVAEACYNGGEYFSKVIREAEEINQALNMEQLNATYTQGNIFKWRQAASQAGKSLKRSGLLCSDIFEAIAKSSINQSGC
ncbi:MAG: TRAP transporter substrate-binding protein DctP [Desulfovermiculus sp.]|nr:TRAP transporter substrate-binding protein DctP [Desulfovermiculus sp.]